MGHSSANDGYLEHWETIKDMVDALIDLMLNLRQSGHPGGSRSKVHLLVSLMLSGAMRWDIRRPEHPLADRFILGAGHTIPLFYAALAVFSEAMRRIYEATKDQRFYIDPSLTVLPEDLIRFRRRGGLPGHAECSGKTHLLRFNTGPSGHGLPAALGQALALRRMGLETVRVFVLEGEGGLTPGGALEARQVAWGLGLGNLFLLLDWNDFGIDPRRTSSVVPGTPREWFESFGWRTYEVAEGTDWKALEAGLKAMISAAQAESLTPSLLFARTRKGRGYLKYDYQSHGSPHTPMNSPAFWETKRPFMERYGIEFEGFGQPAPEGQEERERQTLINIQRVVSLFERRSGLLEYLAGRLLELASQVPGELPAAQAFGFGRNSAKPTDPGPSPSAGEGDEPRTASKGTAPGRGPTGETPEAAGASPQARFWIPRPMRFDPDLFDPARYPESMWAKPGSRASNRQALGRWGGWVSDICRERYGRPLWLACSADLAESTGIAGFAGSWGWYERSKNPEGVLLPQEITEFTNAAMMTGVASTNVAEDPWSEFDGLWGACSTYGAFVYLKYGPMRLFSQTAQDCRIKMGKVLWVAGHSGPETADDSRTHFGIFSPSVTELFPDGAVIDLHPWEYNEVPVMLAEAMKHPAPIVAIHLTRPPIEIPDREALGIPSHFESARGAYVIRPYDRERPRGGVVLVQGTSVIEGLLRVLPEIEQRGLNVKIVAALSRYLFERQPAEFRSSVFPRWEQMDAMFITSRCASSMLRWIAAPIARDYSLSADWDDRWRTGGTVDEVLDEAHLSPDWILAAIERFAMEKPERMKRLRSMVVSSAADGEPETDSPD